MTTATRTRYVVSTNGVDLSTTYTSKGKALETAQTYVWGAERSTKRDHAVTHTISVRTERTGKIVFARSVTVPAMPSKAANGPVVGVNGTPTAYDRNGHAIAVGAWVRTAGMRKIEWQSVLGITPEGRVIVDDDLYGVRADCCIVADFDPSWGSDSVSRNTTDGRTLDQSPTLDTCKINTGSELCGWCDKRASMVITIPTMSHDDYACKIHFAQYYPYLNNAQHESALCPDVERGCGHTMAQTEDGYGVACVEYADAHGIAWQRTA